MKKRTCWIAVLHLGLMTLLGGQCLWAADRERQAKEDDLSAKMRAEGWRQIAEGVFERRRGGAKVEHLAYGREGFAWFVGLLERRREALMRQYESYPSEDLARVIDNLDVTIARARRELRDMPERSPDGLTNLSAAVSGPSCNICYSATADAFHLTTSQGVGAIADAKFNNDCGNVGDTFAFAQARANLNGTQTVVTQEDSDTGTSITRDRKSVV